MEKVYNPTSLFALALQETSKCYRFSSQDASSIVKQIDTYQVRVSDPASPKYSLSYDTRLPDEHKQRIRVRAKRFLIIRRSILEVVCDCLAELIVNPDSADEEDVDKLKQHTAMYIKYYHFMTQAAKLGIRAKLENNLYILLGHVRSKRFWIKLVKSNLNEAQVDDHRLEEKGTCFQNGSGDSVDPKIHKKENINTSTVKGNIYMVSEEAVVNSEESSMTEKSFSAIVAADSTEEESTALYGMICVSDI